MGVPSQAEIDVLESHGHSIFGASKSHRFTRCHGSIFAEFGMPDTAGYEAAEGTVAHEIASMWLEWGLQAEDFEVGKVYTKTLKSGAYEIKVTETMLAYISQYVDWCNAVDGEHYYEQRVDYARLAPIPKQGGTADHFALARGHLTITDLKYGTGVKVFAHRNTQAMLYAIGVIYEWDWLYDLEAVTIRICQPRLDHFDVWETTRAELMEWAEECKAHMWACWNPAATRTPGEEQCKFCPAKPTCPAFVELKDRLADATFEDMTATPAEMAGAVARLDQPTTVQPVVALTTGQLAAMLAYRTLMGSWFEAAYSELTRRVVIAGEPVPPGWMIAEGKTSRSIPQAGPVLRKMRRLGYAYGDVFVTKLMSPAQLEDLLVTDGFSKKRAANFLADVILSQPGKPTLALQKPGRHPATDPADDFDDETVIPEFEDL